MLYVKRQRMEDNIVFFSPLSKGAIGFDTKRKENGDYFNHVFLHLLWAAIGFETNPLIFFFL